MKTVGTKLDNSEYDVFEYCCSEKGLTKSEQLRNLIQDFVNDKLELQKSKQKPIVKMNDDEFNELGNEPSAIESNLLQKKKPTPTIQIISIQDKNGNWVNLK